MSAPIAIPGNKPSLLSLALKRDQSPELGDFADVVSSSLLDQCKEGLLVYPPELCSEGVNGTYFIRNRSGQKVGVFKPQDEESGASNSPRKGDSFPLMKGIGPGDGAVREVAASQIDKHGLYSVPKTIMATLSHEQFHDSLRGMLGFAARGPLSKQGSLQAFVESDCDADEMGSTNFPVYQVQKIAVLDLRILNCDRHTGNILVSQEGDATSAKRTQLIPIDNGYSMPDSFDTCTWFEWMSYSQSRKPICTTLLNHIQEIDINEDQATIASLGIRRECRRTVRVSVYALKNGAAAGLSLYDIGSLFCEMTPDTPSFATTTHLRVVQQVFDRYKCFNEDAYLTQMQAAIDEEIGRIASLK